MSERNLDYLKELAEKASNKCKSEGIRQSWSPIGCALHLEVAQYIEALRGNKGSTSKEIADLLFLILSTIHFQSIDFDVVFDTLEQLSREK